MIEVLEQVTRPVRLQLESPDIVFSKHLRKAPEDILQFGRPRFRIPAEEILLDGVSDVVPLENFAGFELQKLLFKLGAHQSSDESVTHPALGDDHLGSEKLHQQPIIGMNREKNAGKSTPILSWYALISAAVFPQLGRCSCSVP